MTDPLEAQAAMTKAALDMTHAAMQKPAPRTYTQAQWDMADAITNDSPTFREDFFAHPDKFEPCDNCGYPMLKGDMCPECGWQPEHESDRDREGMFDDSFVNGFNKGR